MKPILEFTITAIFVRTLKDEKEGALDFLKKMEGISVGRKCYNSFTNLFVDGKTAVIPRRTRISKVPVAPTAIKAHRGCLPFIHNLQTSA
ncbi:hypothetical protein WN943_004887 [Citrus x changshan-huyou]